jgi:hypothetical protein
MNEKQFKNKAIRPMNPEELRMSPELAEVQPYMPISTEDRERLKKDIQDSGEIRDPIKVYFNGSGQCLIIGGKNRWEIARELKWQYVPVEVLELSPKQRRELAIMDNLARRHLSTSQKSMIIEMFLRNDPVQSNRIISKKTGTDHKTVGVIRSKLESVGEIPRVKEIRGSDGKNYTKAPAGGKKAGGEIPRLKGRPAEPGFQKRDRAFEKDVIRGIKQYMGSLSAADAKAFRKDLAGSL